VLVLVSMFFIMCHIFHKNSFFKTKMVYSTEQKAFTIDSYFRNDGRKDNDEGSCGVQHCLQQFKFQRVLDIFGQT
jgi:hypothetical protein